jgi:hypothetical protein
MKIEDTFFETFIFLKLNRIISQEMSFKLSISFGTYKNALGTQ